MGSVARQRIRLHTTRLYAAAALACALVVSGPSRPALADPPTPTPSQPPAADTSPMTEERALAQAKATGQPVAATAATTATDTVTANPNGTLTRTRALLPARKLVNGAWTALDAALKRNPDGSITPTVTTTDLTLSGGGTGPLATMHTADKTLSVGMPMTLPTPTLSANTATYSSVLPGVDLKVSVDTQGGFSDVLVVHDPTAAANPALTTLTMSTHTTGLTVTADTAGNLTAADQAGHPVFTAPTPLMWDSTTAGPSGGQGTAGAPSTAPGETGVDAGAHQAAIPVTVAPGTFTLTPAHSLLSATTTTWPVYIDPGWSNVKSGWATISKNFPTTKYWNTTPDSSDANTMQVGNVGSIWSHSLVNFNISALAGATIQSAEFNLTQIESYSCTPSTVNVYAPATTLTQANAYWNAWAGVNLGGAVASATAAHGYNGCPAAGVGFDVRTAVQTAVNAARGTQTFVLTGVNEANDLNSWKEFDARSANLSVTYDRAPYQPTGLSTSPATACAGSPPSTVGDADVTLYTPVADPDGDTLNVTFELWLGSTSGTRIDNSVLTAASGTSAVRVIPETLLKNPTGTGNITQITRYFWHAVVYDGTMYSPWSGWCSFNFDPTRPGKPTVEHPTNYHARTCPPAGSPSPCAFMGQPLTLHVTKPPTGSVPAAYIYQLNGAAPTRTPADAAGNTTITITPNRFTNIVSVNTVSPGGNLGLDADSVLFSAAPPTTPQTDGDLTGDNIPDLLTTGGQNGLPAGLWLAPGQAGTGHTTGTGQVIPAAADIGTNGNGNSDSDSTGSPADFTGAQAITGHFTSASNGNLQDILTYNPTTGTGAVLAGNGDGSTLTPVNSANQWTLTPLSDAQLHDGSTGPGNNPQQVVNAGTNTGTTGYPNLIGINGNDTDGHYLAYYDNLGTVAQYSPDKLTTATPDGSDWKTWTLAACQIAGTTDLFLWKKTTGALYLWTNLTHTDPYTLTYTQQTIAASGWNTNATLTLQAADINGDATPDLYTIGTGGVVKTYLTALPSTLTTQPQQTLLTSNHTWLLHDAPTNGTGTDPVTTTADISGALPATATAGANWHTGDLYSPDIALNGATGSLATTGPAVTTTADFTVSAWVKPNTASGIVLSQDGLQNSGFALFIDSTTGLWTFAMTTSDSSATYQYTQNVVGAVTVGVWAHVTATYKASTGVMALYVNGNPSGTAAHTTTWNATGAFHIGNYRVNGTYTGFFNGQISGVQTWNQTLNPTQVADLSGTPGYIMFQTDNTNYTSGTTWTSRCATMNFNAGVLSITMTCARIGTVTYGASGHPTGVLTLQTDGNLVSYPTPTHTGTLWSTGTYGHPGATMFLQNDGNLVIYNIDGTVLWTSNTNNYLDGTALHARANNQYVTADNAGVSPLTANRATAGVWETFDKIDLGGGNIALRAHANGLIVTADNAGASPLIANRTTVGQWETFHLIHNTDGSISLQAAANNFYVTADNAGAWPLIANRSTIGPWEEFDLLGG